jgi:hypothetical protein
MTNLKAVPFHEKSYWESRFEKEKHFEWLLTWDSVKTELEPYLNEVEDILHLGKFDFLNATNRILIVHCTLKAVVTLSLHLKSLITVTRE